MHWGHLTDQTAMWKRVNFSKQGKDTGNLVNLIFYTGKIVATQEKF